MQRQQRSANGTVSDCLALDPSTSTIWEAGHYYVSKGPTAWAQAGWQLMATLASKTDSRMLFVDDIHPIDMVNECERDLDRIDLDLDPLPTHVSVESEMLAHAHEALKALEALPKRHRARKIRGAWHCSGFPLQAESGRPLCLFFDLGLTWRKRQLGFRQAVNVVPEFYAEEQRRLLRLTTKAMPDFNLRVVVHDRHGSWRLLDDFPE